MALLVPDNGGSVAGLIAGSARRVGVVGPLPSGRWIDWISLSLQCTGVATVDIGFTLGPSSGEDDESFSAGVSLITRSDRTVLGIPVVRVGFGASGQVAYTIAVGRRVATGPLFISVLVDVTSGGTTFWLASVRVLGLATETRERLGEPGRVSLL